MINVNRKIHSIILVLCFLFVGCNATERPETSTVEEDAMGATIYTEETLQVGTETFFESASPEGRYTVVFEDDGQTGYFYALDMDKEGNPIVEALHIYNVASVVDKDISSTLQIVWSADGLKSMLLINDYPHAVFDFEANRGYCRSGFPPPNEEWTQYDNEWDDSALELFK